MIVVLLRIVATLFGFYALVLHFNLGRTDEAIFVVLSAILFQLLSMGSADG